MNDGTTENNGSTVDQAVEDITTRMAAVEGSTATTETGSSPVASPDTAPQNGRTPGTIRIPIKKRAYNRTGKYEGLAGQRKTKKKPAGPTAPGDSPKVETGDDGFVKEEEVEYKEIPIETIVKGTIGLAFRALAILFDNPKFELQEGEIKFDEAALAYAEEKMPQWLGDNYGAFAFGTPIAMAVVNRLPLIKLNKKKNDQHSDGENPERKV